MKAIAFGITIAALLAYDYAKGDGYRGEALIAFALGVTLCGLVIA